MHRRALGAALGVVYLATGCGDYSRGGERQRAAAAPADVELDVVRPTGAAGTAQLVAVGSSLVSGGWLWTEPPVQVSGDGGSTWSAASLPADLPHPRDPWIMAEAGGLAFALGAQGDSSQSPLDPFIQVVGERFFAAAGGAAWRSDDEGATWIELGDLPTFPGTNGEKPERGAWGSHAHRRRPREP